jgi:glutamine amidotransferase
MCRHLAYLGAPIALDDLLFDAPHSLCHQARSPRLQTSGSSNPDGWGVGWYEQGAACTYRTTTPIWDDEQFRRAHRNRKSGAVLAAARLASPGAPVEETGNAPFSDRRWLFSLNGVVRGFREGVDAELRAGLSERRARGIKGHADSDVLFALILDRLDAGDDAWDALATVVEHVTKLTTARLNLLLVDDHHLHATRLGNSLFVLDATTVASEPLDDDAGWREVPEGSLVSITDVSDSVERPGANTCRIGSL